LSAGTRTSPRLSVSVRNSLMVFSLNCPGVWPFASRERQSVRKNLLLQSLLNSTHLLFSTHSPSLQIKHLPSQHDSFPCGIVAPSWAAQLLFPFIVLSSFPMLLFSTLSLHTIALSTLCWKINIRAKAGQKPAASAKILFTGKP